MLIIHRIVFDSRIPTISELVAHVVECTSDLHLDIMRITSCSASPIPYVWYDLELYVWEFHCTIQHPRYKKPQRKKNASITYHIQSSVSNSASLAKLSEFKICCFTVLKWAVPEDTVWRLIGLTAAVSWVSLLMDLRHLLCSSNGTAGQTEGLGRGRQHTAWLHTVPTHAHTHAASGSQWRAVQLSVPAVQNELWILKWPTLCWLYDLLSRRQTGLSVDFLCDFFLNRYCLNLQTDMFVTSASVHHSNCKILGWKWSQCKTDIQLMSTWGWLKKLVTSPLPHQCTTSAMKAECLQLHIRTGLLPVVVLLVPFK